MRTTGNLYLKIAEPDNLRLAFYKAARGKADRAEVLNYRINLDANLLRIRKQLLEHAPDIGHYRFFKVRDPKPRSICAAAFPERVLHHAIMNLCEPVLDAYAIYDCYACRQGKGQRKAVARAQKFSRNTRWYLKLDIKKYFDSIDHAVLHKLLAKRFKEKELLTLFAKLLATYCTQPGKGVPIGNLMSQHFANYYLAVFDHHIKETRQIRFYLRYMDDFILFADKKAELKKELAHIKEFLASTLKLELKHNIQLNRNRKGVPFLGYRIFQGRIRLSARSKKRFIKKFRHYEQLWKDGQCSEAELMRHIEPLLDFVKGADTDKFRSAVINRFGVSS